MTTALYLQIYNDLLSGITSGRYPNGTHLPTEHELASQYGVSRITSRRALTMLYDKGLITRHSGIGSVVNVQPQQPEIPLLSGSNSIGLIVEGLWSCYGVGIFEGAVAAAEEAGYNLILKTSGGEQAKEIRAIDSLLALGAGAILISPVHGKYYNEHILKLILENYPLLFIDRYLSGIDAPHIGSNNTEAAAQAVDYLVGKGHKQIAFFTTGRNQASTLEERESGYLRGLANNHLPFLPELLFDDLQCVTPFGWSDAVDRSMTQLAAFLEEHPQVTAVITSEYAIAEMVHHLIAKQRRRLDIICFDSPKSDIGDYPFTHIKQDEEAIGRTAVEMALTLIRKETLAHNHVHIPALLVEGHSTLQINGTR